eukprot:5846779-Pyramimonas_sp.AAC.1
MSWPTGSAGRRRCRARAAPRRPGSCLAGAAGAPVSSRRRGPPAAAPCTTGRARSAPCRGGWPHARASGSS